MSVYVFNDITKKRLVPIDSLTLESGGDTYTWSPLEEGSSYGWTNLYQGRGGSNRLCGCRLDIVAFVWQNDYVNLIPHLVDIEANGIDVGSILLKPIAEQPGAGEMQIGVPDEATLVKEWTLQWGLASGEWWGKFQLTLTAHYSKDVLTGEDADVFNQIAGWS
ncbi:MAG: hypothetical protein KDD67_13760 [Ignavibacteriae bacterium]|nr:hypothetical protein [Ignavibacteriota bacterium]MCB9216147.1 hypothetical protein [Ignavibacteria bacterium]